MFCIWFLVMFKLGMEIGVFNRQYLEVEVGILEKVIFDYIINQGLFWVIGGLFKEENIKLYSFGLFLVFREVFSIVKVEEQGMFCF